jgi:DNA-binding beta-propeller fold protein YncE
MDIDRQVVLLNRPKGIAVNGAGDLLAIAEEGDSRVLLVRLASGLMMREVGGDGCDGNSRLSGPTDVAFTRTGKLLVADSKNSRVVMFDQFGELMRIIGAQGSGDGHFEVPVRVDADMHGNIMVEDSNRVQVLRYYHCSLSP